MSSSMTGRKFNLVDWIGIFVCVVIGVIVCDFVGNRVHPAMAFWPAFGIKVAVGGVVGLVALIIWLGVIRRPPASNQ